MVAELLKSIESGAQEPASYINAKNYTQHNLGVENGMAGFGKVLGELAKFPQPPRVKTIRIFEDKDYVFTHTDYNFFGPNIGFDIFRFENGLIVEHWDNLTPTLDKPNASGHTQIDGEYQVKDSDMTDKNKSVIERFVYDIMIDRDMPSIDQFFEQSGNLIQHIPGAKDGVQFFKDMLQKHSRGSSEVVIYSHLHKVLGEGNFVLAVSSGFAGVGEGFPTSYYDLFRLDNEKIVEMWSIHQPIPEKSEWKNENGKFGFPK